ncbi:chaplin family protein [Streptomyces sp. NBC_00519]|uniref:chaplin family protein n=1 Tax=Streptomyces sp. NBC_00519 TaxID=2975764 RepID=UPI003864F391
MTVVSLTVASLAGTASTASAGGVGAFLSPSFGNSCINHGDSRATGATAHASGLAGGNLVTLPVSRPYNWCGGADLPMM